MPVDCGSTTACTAAARRLRPLHCRRTAASRSPPASPAGAMSRPSLPSHEPASVRGVGNHACSSIASDQPDVNWQQQPKGCATESSTITVAAPNLGNCRPQICKSETVRGVIGVGVQTVEKLGQIRGVRQYSGQDQRGRHAGTNSAGDVVLDAVADADDAAAVRVADAAQARRRRSAGRACRSM